MDTLTLDLVTNTVLDRVSDSELDIEYRKRFFLSAGEKLQKAEDAGLMVVMNDCMLRQHRLLCS